MNKQQTEIKNSLSSLFSTSRPKAEEPAEPQAAIEKEQPAASSMAEPQQQLQLRKRGRPKKNEERIAAGYSRTSLVIKDDIYKKVCAIASKEELPIREIVEGALTLFIQKYEKKNGDIVTERKKKDALSLL